MGSMISVLVTVVVLISVGGSMLLVFKVWSGVRAKQAATERLLAVGIPGTARVRESVPTGTQVTVLGQRSVEYVMALEISLPGRPPYQAQITQLVGEPLFACVFPGSVVSVRVDPTNPQAVAVAGGAAAAPMGGPVIHGGGGGGWGVAPGAPVIHPTAGTAPQGGWGAPPPGVPVGGFGALAGGPSPLQAGVTAKVMQRSMKMTIGILLLTTVPIAIIMAAVFIDWSALGIDVGGGDDEGDGIPKGGYCEATVRCCKVVFGNAASANCDSWKSLPAAGCKSTWESYSTTAKAQGKTCK